ncbi:glycosyltransferase [Dongia deserti]|uniref:glycosyltransferase n=1 Tax=Dongia deserti TaxID=2268030 RepID=UPI0013C44D5C|nr:glycosyltransferase [Dongia deserti]
MIEEVSRQTPSVLAIDVVICTYNRAAGLDAVLANLEQQDCGGQIVWRVLVIDNASTDATPDVVASHIKKDHLPGLRCVFEREQGLTAARLRGVQETTAPWIAFVDDDNFVAPNWLAAVGRAIEARSDAGGIGGKVALDWEVPPPPYLKEFGFCFAEQDHGDRDCVVDSLAGAGMVLRRAALTDSGWLARPLIADRVGRRLVSGGDVEMAQRVRAAGYSLWFTPDAVLKHRIPASRMSRRYLFRVIRGLGTSSALIGALTWSADWQSWRRMAHERRRHWYRFAFDRLRGAASRRRGWTAAIAWTFFALGFAQGVRRCEALGDSQKAALLGAACLPVT